MEVDETYKSCIVVVDSLASGHDWDEKDSHTQSGFQKLIDEIMPYLIEKKILSEEPALIMMTEHQAMDALTPDGVGARRMVPPLAVIIFEPRSGIIYNYGVRFAEGLTCRYYNSGLSSQLPPIVLAVSQDRQPFFGGGTR